MKKIVKLNKLMYPSLSEVDQLIIDQYIDPNEVYSIESEEVENGVSYLYLEGLSNIGLNLTWFKEV